MLKSMPARIAAAFANAATRRPAKSVRPSLGAVPEQAWPTPFWYVTYGNERSPGSSRPTGTVATPSYPAVSASSARCRPKGTTWNTTFTGRGAPPTSAASMRSASLPLPSLRT
ncbi:hypothetical protein [Acuticoccus sp.]|uniref:hypothetical protein n=1 Tax=Acuticoccus sp. TaxID=1904378 RepID=UPI003B515AF6